MFQQSATVNTEELLLFENEKLNATIEDLKKYVDPADTIFLRILQLSLIISSLWEVNENLLLIVWLI